MVRRWVYVIDGVVHSSVLCDDSKLPFEKQYEPEFAKRCAPCEDEQVQSGWTWDGVSFHPPQEPKSTNEEKKQTARTQIMEMLPEWISSGKSYEEIQTLAADIWRSAAAKDGEGA